MKKRISIDGDFVFLRATISRRRFGTRQFPAREMLMAPFRDLTAISSTHGTRQSLGNVDSRERARWQRQHVAAAEYRRDDFIDVSKAPWHYEISMMLAVH